LIPFTGEVYPSPQPGSSKVVRPSSYFITTFSIMTGPSATTKYTGQLIDKRVLIVGGTSGIGYAVAEAALEHGARVTIVGKQVPKLEKALAQLSATYPTQTAGSRLQGMARDLGDSPTVESSVQEILQLAAGSGKLQHLVITAADMTPPPPVSEVTAEGLQRTTTIRLMAPLLFAKHLPGFMDCATASSMTLTSGAHAHKPDAGWSVIAAHCGAVESLMKGLAIDLRPLRVNAVAPGAIMTDVVKDILGPFYDQAIQLAKEKSLVASAGAPEQVAQAYLYLMKDTYVTGSVLESNGGMLLA
jgi:NAD(P)-dependent dehydrogenase (short-subunit alcohol dehydrogenase family)